MLSVRVPILFALSFLCLACTPEEDLPQTSINDDSSDIRHFNDSTPAAEAPFDPVAAGWRHGELHVQLSITQQGGGETSTPEQGGTRTVVSWNFALKAQAEQAVWVPQDLANVLPDYHAAQLPRHLFKDSVFMAVEPDTALTFSGTATYHKDLVIHTPNANDFTSMTDRVDAAGVLTDLRLDAIHPSIYGAGFESRLSLGFSLKGKRLLSSVGAGGSGHRSEEPCCEAGSLDMHLFPQPDPAILPRLTVDPGDPIPAPVIEQQMRMEQDMLAVITQLAATDALRVNLHPGLSHEASRDRLLLHYNLSGRRLPALVDVLDLAAAPATQNSLQLTIELRAMTF